MAGTFNGELTMSSLLESLQLVVHSDNRVRFFYSVFAVVFWILAIALTLLSGHFAIPFGDLVVTALLAISALLAIASVPRRQSESGNKLEDTGNEHLVNH